MRIVRLVATLALSACGGTPADTPVEPVTGAARAFRMGFSSFPPAPTVTSAVRNLETWAPRADAAIIHLEPKWTELLTGEAPSSVARREFESIANFYRSRNLDIVVVVDVTNGVNRAAEARELVAAGRSITEPAIQSLYRAWVQSIVTIVQPVALGLAAETNLIRLAAPAPVYQAVKTMTAAAAADVRVQSPTLPLFVSIQVETAWGRLQGTNQYIGVEQDFTDFPFMQWVGLSSYPYLGRFSEPSEMPDDWYTRPLNGRSLPTVITEGGWTSASVSGIPNVPDVTSSGEKQARWLKRQSQLADRLAPRYLFQLSFADLDLVAWNAANDPQLIPFARLGVMDKDFTPKPALAVWDSIFARPRVR
jgi:hypothetical protein